MSIQHPLPDFGDNIVSSGDLVECYAPDFDFSVLNTAIRSYNPYSSRIIDNGSYEYILNVLAGYIDTDGYIAHSGDYGYVEFCCKSESLISDLQDVLSSLGFKAYRGKDRYNKGYDRYYPRLRLNARDSVELMLLIKDLLVLKHEQAEELISKFSGNTEKIVKVFCKLTKNTLT